MTLELTKQLVQEISITPNDQQCQKIIAQRLEKLGFIITFLPFGEVKNLWAFRQGQPQAPLFVFAGHTDVVPPGDLQHWKFLPFEPVEYEGYLYGRGTQDMKSNIAAMVCAYERLLKNTPDYPYSLGFLITSDEEGPSVNGTAKVIAYLAAKKIFIHYCIVGEPSSQKKIGDCLKIGRRGTLSADVTIHGKQGHIAYPHLACNPIHFAIFALNTCIRQDWDRQQTCQEFEPTSFQISNITAGTGANNVIPNDLYLKCNFRYPPIVTAEMLQKQFETVLKNYHQQYTINWQLSGKPFLTAKGKLLESCQRAIQSVQLFTPRLSTEGGTSDGRFIAPLGTEVIELGVCNDTIHQINECVKISDLETLSIIYEKILTLISQS